MADVAEHSRGRVVGRYAVYGAIAAGGMATVHLGRLLGPVGFSRTVAIKRLHGQYAADPEFVSMFLDEARLAARIRHPNVVPTLDVVAANGELFLVMEYVPGESLSSLAKTARERHERVPLRIVSAIMSAVLHGLHAAHEARSEDGLPLGIVHRDVSPQNVLVGTDGVARVLDFGVAKASGRTQHTREGQIKGKLSYMPPEQIRGALVSRQSDIYAAGVVLWEMLTGERLFFADNVGAIIARVLQGKITPPSHHLGNTRMPALTPQEFHALKPLDEVTLRALDADPDLRFATAREMAIAIERCIAPATPSEVGEWVERVAADVLCRRTQIVADIENNRTSPDADALLSSADGPAMSGASPSPSGPQLAPADPTEVTPEALRARRGPSQSDRHSPLGTISVPPTAVGGSNGPSNATSLALLGAFAIISVVALVAMAARHDARTPVVAPAAVTPAVVTSSEVQELSVAQAAETSTRIPQCAPPPASVAAPAERSPVPLQSSARRSRPSSQPPPKATSLAPPPAPVTPRAASPSDCFWFDANGLKHLNQEDPKCLQ